MLTRHFRFAAAQAGCFLLWLGICLSSAPGGVIERNLLVANREGFDFREQGRTTPRLGAKSGTLEEAVWNHDEIIRHNVIADNRDAQTWGWFDVLDERHWPRAMQDKKADLGEATQNQAKDYIAKDKTGSPALEISCYPIGTVPGVLMGILPTSHLTSRSLP